MLCTLLATLILIGAPAMNEFEGADSLVLFRTLGVGMDQPTNPPESIPQPDPTKSTGIRGTPTRVQPLTWYPVTATMANVTIDWLSAANARNTGALSGVGVLAAADADSLVYTAPGGTAGTPVTIANGETKQISSADPNRYVIATRTSDDDLAGQLSFIVGENFNTALIGSNLTIAESDPQQWDPPNEHIFTGGGRTHCVVAHNKSALVVGQLKFWLPPLGTPQQLGSAAAGLPALGGGTIQVADASDWHPETRFVGIYAADGVTLRELVIGTLAGNVFTVEAEGRGVDGTLIQAGAAGEWAVPCSGLRIGLDAGGPNVFPSYFQGATFYIPEPLFPGYQIPEVPQHPGDLTWGGDLARFLATYNEPTTLNGWSRAYEAANALSHGGPLAADYRVPLFLWMPPQLGIEPTAATPVKLAWSYRVNGQDYAQEMTSWYRIARDRSTTRYQLFNEVDAGPRSLLASGSSLPLAAVPGLSDNATNQLTLVKVNDFDLETLLAETTIVRSGGTSVGVLADPRDVRLVATGSTVTVLATYFTGNGRIPGRYLANYHRRRRRRPRPECELRGGRRGRRAGRRLYRRHLARRRDRHRAGAGHPFERWRGQ
jgi:hypothetical protein